MHYMNVFSSVSSLHAIHLSLRFIYELVFMKCLVGKLEEKNAASWSTEGKACTSEHGRSGKCLQFWISIISLIISGAILKFIWFFYFFYHQLWSHVSRRSGIFFLKASFVSKWTVNFFHFSLSELFPSWRCTIGDYPCEMYCLSACSCYVKHIPYIFDYLEWWKLSFFFFCGAVSNILKRHGDLTERLSRYNCILLLLLFLIYMISWLDPLEVKPHHHNEYGCCHYS